MTKIYVVNFLLNKIMKFLLLLCLVLLFVPKCVNVYKIVDINVYFWKRYEDVRIHITSECPLYYVLIYTCKTALS